LKYFIKLAWKECVVLRPVTVSNATSVVDDVIESGNVIAKKTFRFWARNRVDIAIFANAARHEWISLFDRLESHQFPCLHEFSIILFIFPSTSPNGFNSHTYLVRVGVEGFTVDRQHAAIYRNPLNYFYDPLQHFATHSAIMSANIVCHMHSLRKRKMFTQKVPW